MTCNLQNGVIFCVWHVCEWCEICSVSHYIVTAGERGKMYEWSKTSNSVYYNYLWQPVNSNSELFFISDGFCIYI
jgi:hypothetical protein